ncbi:MAG: protein kinase [Phycisphaerae bacterium]|nr:protein kinase [Phycisphaerae bacterium]
MASGSTFGSDPDRLRRLLSVGVETHTSAETSGAVDPLDILLEKPGARIGRYEILSVLGEGGMGIVYLARQHEPIKRQVALKVIKPGMDSRRVIARFEAEQQALAMIDHPHVARVYDGGVTAAGRPYFVMEYVAGVPITEYCDEHKLSLEERLALFLRVCEAVQHAHQKGIIHRDLKPSNILVVASDKEAIPKVIDFGVARALTRSLAEQTLTSEPGQIIGTPEYMSPEQANLGNPDIDIRSDVYSLGVVLYRLLCGSLPHETRPFREGGIETIRKVLMEQDPRPPSARLRADSADGLSQVARCRHTDVRTLYRKLAGDLDWITLKAIAKDRARRYATADAFALDIRRYLRCEPVSAAPPGVIYRSRKFFRRHRVVVMATLAVILTMAGVTLGVAMYGRARQAQFHAQSIDHNRVLSEARVLFDNRQYEPARQILETIIDSRHVNRAARLLRAKAIRELQGPAAAVEELKGLLGPADEITGEAHFLLAKTYDETKPTDAQQATEYNQQREYHRSEAERLVPAIARYYFLRRQVSLANQERLDLLRRSLQLAPGEIFGAPANVGPAVNSPHSEITPSISADGLILCFTSDRPGGRGDYDIWMAARASLEDVWSEPVNLGPPVNTSDFEGFQSISSDGLELYFSRGSTDHGDIYVAVRSSPEDQWQAPVRLPASINSETGQDWGAVPSFDGLTLCWISTRPGGPGGMDIWFVRRPVPRGEWSGCPEPLPPPVNSPALEGRKCTSADERILFFQRPDVGESLYVSIRESKTDPWSSPVDLGPVLAGSRMPYITSLSANGAELYFCDHPWTEPRTGGQGREDIWYLPLTASARAATTVETRLNASSQP